MIADLRTVRRKMTKKADHSDSSYVLPKSLPSVISQVILDAIRATLKLGYRYLWTDKYCINQGDSAELISQIHCMDLIYNSAQLTMIVANTQGTIGTPNIASEPITSSLGIKLLEIPEPCRIGADDSLWNSRAWTMQEDVASRRCLFFTDNGLYYRGCKYIWDGRWKTGLRSQKTLVHPWTFAQPDGLFNIWVQAKREMNSLGAHFFDGNLDFTKEHNLPDPAKYTQFCWEHSRLWNRLATEYTRRMLTDQTDIIHAFYGVAESMTHAANDLLVSLQYIPFCRVWGKGEEFLKVQSKIFVLGLLWASIYPQKSERREPERFFPSWSWIGWTGQVMWLDDEHVTASKYGSMFTVLSTIFITDFGDQISGIDSRQVLSLEEFDRYLAKLGGWHMSIFEVYSLRIQGYNLDRLTLLRGNSRSWKMSFSSVKFGTMIECGIDNEEQAILKGIDDRTLSCVVMGEFMTDEHFCLVLRALDSEREQFERIGLMVLKKSFDVGEEPCSIATDLNLTEQQIYTIL